MNLTKKLYTKTEVERMISIVEGERVNKPKPIIAKPNKVKKGDVFLASDVLPNPKKRPYVVIKTWGDNCACLPLSSSEKRLFLMDVKCRFLEKDSFLCSTIVVVNSKKVLNNFLCVYDNMQNLNKAIDKMKNLLTYEK